MNSAESQLEMGDKIHRSDVACVEHPAKAESKEGACTRTTSQAESLLAAEKRTLEMIADGASLKEILDDLCHSIDVVVSPVISTVLLMDADGERLWHTAGTLVPREWLPVVSPLRIFPHAGCCGAAAFMKERVIVADIATDINWLDEYRDLAIKNGIRAAWSEPILTKDGEVLGTFALYSSESRIPTDAEIELIEGARHIALIAIERQRSQAALALALEKIKRNEESLRLIVDSIPGQIAVMSAGGEVELVNRQILEYFGKTTEELQNWATSNSFHPDDILRTIDAWKRALETGQPFEFENRGRRADGVYRWFHVRARPLRDAEGRIVHWYVLATDIDDRKHSEGELGKAFEEIKRLKDRLHDENVALREQIDQVFMFEEIVGSSPALKTVLSSIVKVAPTDSTVLITGETGTGKELIARAIHKGSRRAGQAFISVNCAAIPSSLIASELFGHEKGAFTGALQRRQGRFELAHSGTIFLDEIGELPAETQLALLRVLQEREFERVGGSRVIPVDVRVIAATNRDLEAAITAGVFRSDLFYRLNVFPIDVPPLRQRTKDIPMLIEYFVKRYAEKVRKKISKIDKTTLKLGQSYHWPGNIRELQNIVERSVILCTGDTFWIDEAWLSSHDAPRRASSHPLTENLHNYEKELIEAALAESNGIVAGPNGAAVKLGIPRSTLDLKIKQLNIRKHTIR
ncbi:MAG TPA: sigma 54-interacting transcriptional regulator [Candidatus Acidoferrales bacterium]|nr:sigma 54-interacting transcriptional regulator [Candidatus Acidoferrales bacterium]